MFCSRASASVASFSGARFILPSGLDAPQNSVTVQTEGGRMLQSRSNPRSSFSHQALNSPWDDLHVAYFNSYALWTYLTIPFLYTYPGFFVEEISPWNENGEEWRRLKAIFPDGVATHTKEQVSYFGPDGLLRRHQYTVDVLGARSRFELRLCLSRYRWDQSSYSEKNLWRRRGRTSNSESCADFDRHQRDRVCRGLRRSC